MYCPLHEHHDHQPLGFYLNWVLVTLSPQLSEPSHHLRPALWCVCPASAIPTAPHFPRFWNPWLCTGTSCLPLHLSHWSVSFFRTWFVSGQRSQYYPGSWYVLGKHLLDNKPSQMLWVQLHWGCIFSNFQYIYCFYQWLIIRITGRVLGSTNSQSSILALLN